MAKIKGLLGREDKYVYLGSDYKPINDEKYDEAEDFKNGYAKVKVGGKKGWIDLEGNWYDKLPKE